MPTPNQTIDVSLRHPEYLKMQEYLKILSIDVPHDGIITWASIRTAYKNRALIVHPDKGGSEVEFKALNNAVEGMECLFNDEYGLDNQDMNMPSSATDLWGERLKTSLKTIIDVAFERLNKRQLVETCIFLLRINNKFAGVEEAVSPRLHLPSLSDEDEKSKQLEAQSVTELEQLASELEDEILRKTEKVKNILKAKARKPVSHATLESDLVANSLFVEQKETSTQHEPPNDESKINPK